MNKLHKLVIGSIIAIVAIYGGHRLYETRATNEPLKIGVIGTLTGNAAYFGQQELRGAELARDEINRAGGINGKKIEFMVEDSAAEPAKAVSVVQKLTSVDNIKYIIGDSWNSTVVPLVPVINEKRVILISPLAGLNQLSQDDYFFRTISNTRDMMDALAEHAYAKLGYRAIGVLQQKNPYGEEHTRFFTEAFEKLGGRIVSVEQIDMTQEDVRSELAKINSKSPDAILDLHASGQKVGMVIRQAKELGIRTGWLGHMGSENAAIQKDYKGIADGIAYPYPFDITAGDTEAQKFVKLYQEKYNESPELVAANAYDAVMVLAKTIAVVGDDTRKAKEYISTIRDFKGAGGIISFDQNGDVKKNITVKVFKDGLFMKAE